MKTKSTKDPLASLKVAAPAGEAAQAGLEPLEGLFDSELDAEAALEGAAPQAAAPPEEGASPPQSEKSNGGRGASSDAPHEEPPLPVAPPPPPDPLFEVLEDRRVSWGPQTIRLRKGQRVHASRYGGLDGIARLQKAGVKLQQVAD